MIVPLTNAILHSMPPERSGVASALLNASREVAGLLGITVIGAVLRSRQGATLRHSVTPGGAYLDGLPRRLAGDRGTARRGRGHRLSGAAAGRKPACRDTGRAASRPARSGRISGPAGDGRRRADRV
jgi:hypothetical protein